MIQRLRLFLLRSLLLALCLHAGAGVVQHEARHFEQLARQAHGVAEALRIAEPIAEKAPAEPTDEHAHTLCVWCAAFALQATGPGAGPSLPPRPEQAALPGLAPAPVFVAAPLQGRFPARGPPVAEG